MFPCEGHGSVRIDQARNIGHKTWRQVVHGQNCRANAEALQRRKPGKKPGFEVVEAAEGPLRLERCTLSGGPCHWEDSICAVHAAWEQANKSLTATLSQESLAKVLAVDDRLRVRRRRVPRSWGEPPRPGAGVGATPDV